MKDLDHEVHHVDGDFLNCRRANLTISQDPVAGGCSQCEHRFLQGISWDWKRNQWKVQVQRNGVRKFGGMHRDLTSAKATRDALVEDFLKSP
jgi:hypothetical protein